MGRETGQVRLRVVKAATGTTLREQVEQFTQIEAGVYTDEYESCHRVDRDHSTVCHRRDEWGRDEDGDGFCEVHANTIEGLGSGLRVFRGVHTCFLRGYVAIHEFRVNLKPISVSFIAALVRLH